MLNGTALKESSHGTSSSSVGVKTGMASASATKATGSSGASVVGVGMLGFGGWVGMCILVSLV